MSKNKLWLFGAGILVGIICLLAFFFRDAIQGPGNRTISVTKDQAVISFNGEDITVPAPPGYCFVDTSQEIDRLIVDVMQKMQTTYGNHLWLAFADCRQLEAVRISKNLNAYVDTGMVVTPLPFLTLKSSAEIFTSTMRGHLKALNPVNVEKFVNKAARNNMSFHAQIKTGQPLVYGDDSDSLLFLMRHDMSDPSGALNMELTEFDVVTAIKNRPLVILFTKKNLTDLSPDQELTKAYLSNLRSANP